VSSGTDGGSSQGGMGSGAGDRPSGEDDQGNMGGGAQGGQGSSQGM
jgi:hypothetical protein